MSDAKGDISNAQIMHSIGELVGTVKLMHEGLTARISDIKADIQRLEASQKADMNRVEDAMNKRIDGVATRVANLEAEDKRLIEKVGKLSVLGGGVTAFLTAAAIEMIKRAAH